MPHRRSGKDRSKQLSATAASMYRAGRSIRQVGRALGLAPSGVLWLLRREGVETRAMHDHHGNPPRSVREHEAGLKTPRVLWGVATLEGVVATAPTLRDATAEALKRFAVEVKIHRVRPGLYVVAPADLADAARDVYVGRQRELEEEGWTVPQG